MLQNTNDWSSNIQIVAAWCFIDVMHLLLDLKQSIHKLHISNLSRYLLANKGISWTCEKQIGKKKKVRKELRN